MDADGEVAAIRKELEEMKSLSKFDPELDDEMRSLNNDLREAADMSSPHKPSKPASDKPDAEKPDTKSND